MTTKEKSIIQEQLVILYLRLNGYFTTGHLIHANTNNIDSELDILAVRFPLHNQAYTGHGSSDFLEIPNGALDLIIGEVKSKGQNLQFNRSLRGELNLQPLENLLKWIGILSEAEIVKVAIQLRDIIQPKENSRLNNFSSITVEKSAVGRVSIRPIVFSPERMAINNANKFICWTELNDFIWMCLCPPTDRNECGIQYDFTAWGPGLDAIVKVYKKKRLSQVKPSSIEELYKAIASTT